MNLLIINTRFISIALRIIAVGFSQRIKVIKRLALAKMGITMQNLSYKLYLVFASLSDNIVNMRGPPPCK